MPAPDPRDLRTPNYRSKTLATWIATVLGSLGLHRMYLRGYGDLLAWLHPPLTFAGLIGVTRMREFGQDDRVSWILIPILGAMISQGMLCAIVYALTPDEKWDARHNPGLPGRHTHWGPVLGAIGALMVGAAVLMGSVAFAVQKFFEWSLLGPG